MQSLDPTTDLRKLPAPNQTLDISKANCEKIISIAEKVIANIDQEKLLAYFGMKNDNRPDATKIKMSVPFNNYEISSFAGKHFLIIFCSQQEKQRGYLLDAFTKKGIALCKLHLSNDLSEDEVKPSTIDNIKQTVADILKFTDLTDSKVNIFLFVQHEQSKYKQFNVLF